MNGHRQRPAGGAGQAPRPVDDAAWKARPAALEAACALLADDRSAMRSISVSGQLSADDIGALPVLAEAERLAVAYELAVELRLDGSAYEVHFRRRAQ